MLPCSDIKTTYKESTFVQCPWNPILPISHISFRPSITHETPSVFHTDQRCENGAGVKRQIFEALQFPNKYENMFIIKSLIVIQKGAGPMGKYLLSQW